jgi:hypothetical protein
MLFVMIIGILVIIFGSNTSIISVKGIGWTLVSLVIISFANYVVQIRWLHKSEKNPFEFKSPSRELSTPEKFVADYFKKKGIRFVYEKPIKLGTQSLKPDFYLPEYNVYVEVWGNFADKAYYNTYTIRKKTYDKYKADIRIIHLYKDNYNYNGKFDIHQLDWIFTKRLMKILKEDV